MKQVFLSLILLVFIFATCKSKDPRQENPALRMPDPTAFYTADSLRYLLPILDSVLIRDQQYRYNVKDKKSGSRETSSSKHVKEIQANDRLNLRIVEDIIKKHGWLGYKDIGVKANLAMFMVIQHADSGTQERYLPLLENALREKKLLPSHYAMLYDRIEIRKKRPQRYGTQVNLAGGKAEVLPLSNPDSLHVWRRSIGMIESYEQYLRQFNITWDSAAYKQQLPALKKKYNIQ
jgi:hypothetical protein